MTNGNVKYPQFINVDAGVKDKYLRPLVEDPASVFYKSDFGDVYFIAASLGFKNASRKKTEDLETLRLYDKISDKYKLLIRVIVLASEKYDYDILLDGKKTLKVVEEYANGGASILFDKIFNAKGLDFSIEDEIWNELQGRR